MLKKQTLDFIKQHPGRVLDFREWVRELDVDGDQKKELRRILDELGEQDIIHKIKRSRFAIPARAQLISGRLSRNRAGYGFVTPERESGLRQDIFIPARHLQGALHGDTVLIKVEGRAKLRGKLEGAVIQVIRRSNQKVVGKFYFAGRQGYVVPLDERYPSELRVALPGKDRKRLLKDGWIVAVEIPISPGNPPSVTAAIIEILGDPETAGIEYKIVQSKYDIPSEFPAEVLQEARSFPQEVGAADVAGREDLRGDPAVTIDGETARDFDDAVTLDQLANGHYRLGVHIADVAHYVREPSLLDQEANRRGTSVYFPDRAVPMLPPELSSGICSLNPQVDRLTLSVLMEINQKGEVVDRRFVEGVISSRARMTYTAVKKILVDKDRAEITKYRDLVDGLHGMQELCLILNARRRRRGAIDFDLAEAEVIYDERGAIQDIRRSERNIAHRLIEEFMLLANETVALYLSDLSIPSLYRIHEEPDPIKTKQFAELATLFGYRLQGKAGKYRAADFQRLADQLSGQKEAPFLSYLMLRSFMLARYSDQNIGHFGLASQNYTHFTSPIRRYPDLVVHRILKETLRRAAHRQSSLARRQTLPLIAEHSSERERQADAAEREILDIKGAQFMEDNLGEVYPGFITRVDGFGFSVELLHPFVEGTVPVSVLRDDGYWFDDRRRALVGERRRRVYRLGDRLSVRVDRVDKERGRIFFSPA